MKNNKGKILIVAAHPDDEILGAGGTLLRLIEERRDVHISFLSKGETSRGKKIANEKLRVLQAKKVANKLGGTLHWLANFPDNEFDTVSLLEITRVVEKFINKLNPETIYTHHHGDLNIDHRRTLEAVITAARPGKTTVKQIFSFEVLSSTEWQTKRSSTVFMPDTFVDIKSYIDRKIYLLSIYEREIKQFPFPRSADGIRTLAKMRGMESGLKFAEAFETIRQIIE